MDVNALSIVIFLEAYMYMVIYLYNLNTELTCDMQKTNK